MKKQVLIFCVILLFFTGFKAESNTSTVLKIGVILPLSGFLGTYGVETFKGMKLAVHDINSKSDTNGFKLELAIEDNRGNARKSTYAYKKLVTDNVLAVIGPILSTNGLALKPAVSQYKTPFISPSGTFFHLTSGNEYVSRICFVNSYQAKAASAFVLRKLKKKTAVILYNSEIDSSRDLASTFEKHFKKNGGKLLGKFSLKQDEELVGQLGQIKSLKPDIIFLPTYHIDAGNVLRISSEIGLNTAFIGSDGWDVDRLIKLSQKGYAGHFFTTHFSVGGKSKILTRFVGDYQNTYKKKPGAQAALGYDSVYFFTHAVKRTIAKLGKSKVGSREFKEELKNQINSTSNFEGVTGTITLDKHRNPIKSVFVMQTTKKGPRFFTTFIP